MEIPFVSVIICTYNRGEMIKDCLDALIDQDYPKDKSEIIVVDGNSTDNTVSIIQKYKRVKLFFQTGIGLSNARNCGVKNSKGEIIVFTDDDCIPHKDWLKNLVEIYKNLKVGGVGGLIVPYKIKGILNKYLSQKNPLSPLPKELEISHNLFYRFYLYMKNNFRFCNEDSKVQKEVFSLVGANMSFRKEVIEKLNGWDERFIGVRMAGGDETDFCMRFHKNFKEKKLIYTPKAIVIHKHPSSLKDFLLKNNKYGKGNAMLFHKYPEQNIVLFPFPLMILFFSFLLLFYSMSYSLFLLFFLPHTAFLHWNMLLVIRKKLYFIIFPYFQFLEELLNNIGFIMGLIEYRNLFRGDKDDINNNNSKKR